MFATRVFEEGGVQGGTGWMVWVALTIFFLMVFLGWLASNKGWLRSAEEPVYDEYGHSAHKEGQETTKAGHDVTGKVVDDLTTLEGIGTKAARVLAGIGIITYEELAHADPTKVKAALGAAGYKYMDPSGWIEQADLAAKGDTDGLKKLQESLNGGRKAS